jgi:hypothetical protein
LSPAELITTLALAISKLNPRGTTKHMLYW